MGFNSTIIILNDCLHAIRDDKEFGQKIWDAVNKSYADQDCVTLYSKNGNCGEVVHVHHADDVKLLVVGGNTGIDLGYFTGYQMLWNEQRAKLWRRIKQYANEELKKLNAKKQSKEPVE